MRQFEISLSPHQGCVSKVVGRIRLKSLGQLFPLECGRAASEKIAPCFRRRNLDNSRESAVRILVTYVDHHDLELSLVIREPGSWISHALAQQPFVSLPTDVVHQHTLFGRCDGRHGGRSYCVTSRIASAY